MGIGPQNLGAGGGKKGHTPCGHPTSPFNKVSQELRTRNKEKNLECQMRVNTM